MEKIRKGVKILTTIKGWINNDLFIPGERLPSERKLADYFNVSRNSIRDALSMLAEQGVVEIRHGRHGGAYLTNRSPVPSKNENVLLRGLDNVSYDQIAEFREAIEREVTMLAAQRADSCDIRRLRCLLGELRLYLGAGVAESRDFINADKRIHLYVAKIAQNPLIAQSIEATLKVDDYFNRFLGLPVTLKEENFKDLNNIIDAIEAHQIETAGSLATFHINRFNEVAF